VNVLLTIMDRPPGQVWVRKFIIYTVNGIPNVNINEYTPFRNTMKISCQFNWW